MKGATRIAKKFLPTTILEAKILINLSKLFMNEPLTNVAPVSNACFATAHKFTCLRLDIIKQFSTFHMNVTAISKK